MLSSEPGWEFLEQHPELLQALVTRLDTNRSFVEQVVDLLLHWADCDDDMVWWVLGQPLLMEAVLRMLVKHDSWGCTEVVKWLQGDPSLMEALLRQPPLVADVLLGLVHHKRRHQRLALASATGDEYEFPCIQQLLVEGLATPDFVARALAVMLGLLGSGSDQLSAGVFEAMGIIQRKLRSHPSSARVVWGRELAVVAAKAAPVLQATEQLQALRQVVVEVQGAAAAATHALEHKQQQRRQQQEAAERQLEVKAGDKLQQSCRSTTPRARAQRQRRQQVQQGVRGAAPQGPGPVVLAAAAFRKKPAREQQLPNRQ
jgi:hypothetical protein